MTTDFEGVDKIVTQLLSSGFNVSISSVILAKKFLTTAHQKRITAGRRPVSLAAAALYIACRLNENNIPQKELADAGGLSEMTLRSAYKLLTTHLGIVYRENDNTPKKIDRLRARLQKIMQRIDGCTQKKKELELEPNVDANLIEIYVKVLKDLTAEADSILVELKILGTRGSNKWKCPHCENYADQELKECPDCGWHPMPSCAEAYKTP